MLQAGSCWKPQQPDFQSPVEAALRGKTGFARPHHAASHGCAALQARLTPSRLCSLQVASIIMLILKTEADFVSHYDNDEPA